MANPDFTGVLSSDRSSFEGELPGSIHFGIQGPPGPPGKDGTVAFEDLTAEQIESLRGRPGPSGKTAYEYAQDGGYTGSETDFAAKLAMEYLPLSGGTMEGPINMNGQRLTGLNAPVEDSEAATKEYVDDTRIPPVGYIYISADATSPASIYGGEWEQRSEMFLLGAGDRYKAGSTGGEEKHTLTLSEIPNHMHQIAVGSAGGQYVYYGASQGSSDKSSYGFFATGESTTAHPLYARGAGGGQSHNNMPPYFAVYMWQRVA